MLFFTYGHHGFTMSSTEDFLFTSYRNKCIEIGEAHQYGTGDILALEKSARGMADTLGLTEDQQYYMLKETELEVIAEMPNDCPWFYAPEQHEVKPDPRSGVEDRDNDTEGVFEMDWDSGEMVRVSHENVTAVVSQPATPEPVEPEIDRQTLLEMATEWHRKQTVSPSKGWTLDDIMEGPRPARRPYVINGLLRVGETGQINAPSKAGKSWLVLQIALSAAAGRPDFGATSQEPVDIILFDSELHKEELQYRMMKSIKGLGLAGKVIGNVTVHNLRGKLGASFERVKDVLSQTEINRPTVCILDALYRFMPKGISENDNSKVTEVFNELDEIAIKHGVAFLNIHHSSKGNQSEKSSLDTGSGAGAFARAPDTIVAIREHAEDNHYVIDITRRSDASPPSMVYRREFPLWVQCNDKNPDLKRAEYRDAKRKEESAARKEEKISDERASSTTKIVSMLRNDLILSESKLIGNKKHAAKDRLKALMLDLTTAGVIYKVKYILGQGGVKKPLSTLPETARKAYESGQADKKVHEGYSLTENYSECLTRLNGNE